MSMISVTRILTTLRASLPDAAVQVRGGHMVNSQGSDREYQLASIARISDLFGTYKELTDISFDASIEEEEDRYMGKGERCFLKTELGFEFEYAESVCSVTLPTNNESEVKAEFDRIAEELFGVGGDAAGYRELEERRIHFQKICSYYEDNIAVQLEEVDFWRKRSSLLLRRSEYEKCCVNGKLDVDALRMKSWLNEQSGFAQQMDLSGPPVYWNEVSVRTIDDRLAVGMDVEACDNNGVSALVAATVHGRIGAVNRLLDAGADPNSADGTGVNALSAAVAVEFFDMAQLLVDRGANPNGSSRAPSILVAIAANNGDAGLRRVLNLGADLRAKMPNGKPFYETAEQYLVFANGPTRSEVMAHVNSIRTEQGICAEIDEVACTARSSKSKSTGMAL